LRQSASRFESRCPLAIAYLLACDGPILTNYEWGLKMRLTERTPKENP
jgi:hypothetical protein